MRARMYEHVQRYLARVWFRSWTPPSTILELGRIAELLGESSLTPSNIHEINANGIVPRVGLTHPERLWSLRFLKDTIDLDFQPPSASDLSFDEFLDLAVDVLPALTEHVGVKAYRVAAIQEGLLPGEPSPELPKRLFLTPPGLESALFEWDWRLCKSVHRVFGASQEDTNTIATVRRITAEVVGRGSLDRIFLGTDINTSNKRTEERLSAVEVKAFLTNAKEWHRSLANEVLTHMGEL
jgi:hypothetical protein